MRDMNCFRYRWLLLAFVAAIFDAAPSVRGQSGVAGGSADGESGISEAADGTTSQPVPNTPVLASAIRLDKEKIKVTIAPWDGGEPLDLLHVLRAQDDGPWEDVSPSGPAGGSILPIEFEDPAPADHDYRYVAIVIGARQGIGMNIVASNPSNELRVSDTAATFQLGAGPDH
jgi:hypothetical protein